MIDLENLNIQDPTDGLAKPGRCPISAKNSIWNSPWEIIQNSVVTFTPHIALYCTNLAAVSKIIQPPAN